jgi:precorrin-8X/cobalt-precorrin-8 methylmutase
VSLLQRYGLPPSEIEARSLALVERLAGPCLPDDPGARQIATLMLYATGDPALAPAIRIHPRAVESGLDAIRRGAPIVTDVRMVAAAVEGERLERFGCRVVCALEAGPNPPALFSKGKGETSLTRTAAGILALADKLEGTVVVIGNAPTALLALLDLVDGGRCQPALVIGTPVGLVAASEAKAELIRREVPYVTVLGPRGGSAIAAAALNGLLRLAVRG